jgi:hypothetical protein
MSAAMTCLAFDLEGKTHAESASGGAALVRRTYTCRGCRKTRTFVAATEKLVGWQIASAGWKVDGARGECPTCWMAYEASVFRAAKGNT